MNKKMMTTVALVAFFAAFLGFLAASYLLSMVPAQSNKLVAEYYKVENATNVSPHGLRKKIDKGDESFVLVDLRSQQEYEKEHIVGAVSVPAYSDPDTSAYDDVERIVTAFKDLQVKNPEKEIIVYCYSAYCMTGRKVGKMLVDEGIYVKHLGIGWNEWKYNPQAWNHEHEWATYKVENYISAGKEPGVFKFKPDLGTGCPINNDFGC